ncbi:MAG: hypothetical protein KKD28_05595, partial [Chloroflexi bacterium]|nr:hypothetical protein [Chloroflexota bacterium]
YTSPDGDCSTTNRLTVREPSSITGTLGPKLAPISRLYGWRYIITYTVKDQFGQPMAGVCTEEVIDEFTCHPSGWAPPPEPGLWTTDGNGQFTDPIEVSTDNVTGLPDNLVIIIRKTITAGGCVSDQKALDCRPNGIILLGE